MLPDSISFCFSRDANGQRIFTPEGISFLVSKDITNDVTGAIECTPNEHGAHLLSDESKQRILAVLNEELCGQAKADARLVKARADHQAKEQAKADAIAEEKARIKAEQDAEAARIQAEKDAAKGKAKA
jgi:hypothetical protein